MVDKAGSGYTSAPTVVLTNGGGFTSDQLIGFGQVLYTSADYPGEYFLADVPAREETVDEDIGILISSGAVVVAAAGNSYYKIDVPGGQDYNNSLRVASAPIFKAEPSILTWGETPVDFHYQRGSTPGSSPDVICVGAAGAGSPEYKAQFSNTGPRVDIYAPGEYINSSVNPSMEFVPHGIADPRNASYSLTKWSGTSMASPQVAGMLACYARSNRDIDQNKALAFLVDNAKPALNDGTQYRSLQGGTNRYAYMPDVNTDRMVLRYDTSKEPANNTISIPLAGTVNVRVEWGDGTWNQYTTSGFKTHTYASAGTYTVEVFGTMTSLDHGTGANTTSNKRKLVACLSFGNLGITNMTRAFRGCSNLAYAPSSLPSGVTNCSEMFRDCTSFNHPGPASWSVSSVTNMSGMFRGCSAFNADISRWSTTSATNMTDMFRDCAAFAANLSGWSTGSVTTMSGMLLNADAYDCSMASWNLAGLNASSALDNFMSTATGLSTANYNATLVGWNANKNSYRNDLRPNFGGSRNSCSGSAATSRSALVSYGWTITDGGCV